ncbi:MAG: DEAD/DEAH box helicase family protein, partial [Clostridia bacterium]|nr:DEAD/DEAH box helicase family protein [Clostridia bacterium]
MRELKNYQEEAVVQLLTYSSMYFNLHGNETIVFQSPTGSGKTFMMSRFIMELSKITEHDLCFLWVSIGKGDLHKQSMKSVKREIDNVLTCSLLENDFFGSREIINQNEVVFVNWEKIRNKDKESGDFKNILMKDKETYNFIEVLRNTRDLGRKIVLIIDESHSGATTNRAQEIRDEIISPELTIEMSATPVLMGDMQARVTVDPIKVINEEMIKKEILINPNIEEMFEDEMDSETLILESAYNKREKLSKLYKENNSIVNPLVLIQLPNSTAGEEKKESVIKFLEAKGVSEQNGKLAVWLSDEKINNESEKLLNLDGCVEYLIFKQAIDTGWDCPRAQILVKFRETKSIVFEIQTVGRILRMPEAKHYMSDDLNRAFVYTNIQSISIKKEIYNPNILKSKSAKRNDKYISTPLRSYYRNRVDYGDITSSFYIAFEHKFCEYFGIRQIRRNEIADTYINIEKLRLKGVVTEYAKTDSILSDVRI